MELTLYFVLTLYASVACGRKRRYKERDEDFCELELNCKNRKTSPFNAVTDLTDFSIPIRGPRGPRGELGEKGERGLDGLPGKPGIPGTPVVSSKKVAFFVGLSDNLGPVEENTDVVFDHVITNVGGGFEAAKGHFIAPVKGVYQFNVVISAQGRQKAAVMLLKNGAMVATVWAESIPYWASASNVAVLEMNQGDEVWLSLLNRASYLHGYMYTTFSGFLLFEE